MMKITEAGKRSMRAGSLQMLTLQFRSLPGGWLLVWKNLPANEVGLFSSDTAL